MDIRKIAEFLELKRPFVIKIKSKPHAKYMAAYWTLYKGKKLHSHLIHVHMYEGDRGIPTLIAHELIHAWQEENAITETHGPEFQSAAEAIEQEFGIEEIYLPNIDV